jgi:hypothetical protein
MAPGQSVEHSASKDAETDFDDHRSLMSDGFEGEMNPKFFSSAPAQMGSNRGIKSRDFNTSAYPPDDTYSALYQNSAPTPQAQVAPAATRSMSDSQRRGRAVLSSPSATMPSSRPAQSASSANATPNSMWFTMDDSAASRPSHANLLPRSMSAGKQRPQASRGQWSGADASRRRQIMGIAGGKIERWCIVLGPLTKVRRLSISTATYIRC